MKRTEHKAFYPQFHTIQLSYEEKVFSLIFLIVLLICLSAAEYLQHIRVHRAVYVPKIDARRVTEIILREPAPAPIEKPVKKLPPRKLTRIEKKKRTAPSPSSAVGSPKAIPPKKKKDIKKMVARKGLLGLLSKESTDTTLRAYQPSKKRDVSEELDQALKNLSQTKPKDKPEDDFLGIGNLPEVAKKGTDIGYILDAAKIGEVKETQVEFYGGIEELPEEIVEEFEEGTEGRSTQEIRRIVASYLGGLRYLYNKELRKKPELQGKAVIMFEISPAGNVTKTSMVSSSLQSASLNQDIMDNIRKWKFPRISPERGSVKVTYPFLFLPPSS